MIDAYQASSQARVNAALEPLFVAPSPELKRLYEAMRYSVMNGGKRVRPLLAYAACEALGGNVMTDAFGLVALVAMMPLITVQVMGAIYVVKSRHASQEPQLPDFGDNEIIELWEAC